MDILNFVRSGDEPYMQFDRLKLRNYFPHEVEKLSVLRVRQTRAFDEVGHPIRGGLYDPAFGPLEARDRCETCNQYEVHCPGSCVQCHRFTCGTDGIATKILLAQLRCFEIGVPHLSLEIETQFKDALRISDQSKSILLKSALISTVVIVQFSCGFAVVISKEEEMQMLAELDKLISDSTGRPLSSFHPDFSSKNSVDLRKTIIRNYLRDHLFKRKARCPLCKGFNGQLRNDGSRCVLIDFTVHGRKMKKLDTYKSGFEGQDLEDAVQSDDEEDKMGDKVDNVGYGSSIEMVEGALDVQMKAVRNGACEKASGLCPLDGLFCELIVVPPTKFRPIRLFKGEKYENPQSVNLRRVLEATETIKVSFNGIHLLRGYEYLTLLFNAVSLELDKHDQNRIPGIKQILEKKQGLFRMNMMGKRVNFACRSVITPDPYLDVDEIGVPEVFAKKLTFTEPVNLFNKERLRKFVRNGPDVHPGTNRKQMLPGNSCTDDGKRRRTAVARSLEPANTDKLRQPMKAYNADFDGDEMNGHLTQSHIAQCEVAELANVGNNFLVPRDATPLLGLIQDHVVSGVLLTIRGRFLSKEDFMHLVLSAFAEQSTRINIPQPAMIKPLMMWSGKQVISCIIKNCVPRDKPLINLVSKSKTPLSCWKVRGFNTPPYNMSESEVVFRQGELLVGVLDKQHYGATQYGLIHSCFELYGHKVGVQILSCLSLVLSFLISTFIPYSSSRSLKVVRSAFGLDDSISQTEIKRVLASAYCSPQGEGQDVKMLDYSMKQAMSKYNDVITKACVPDGLIRQFPDNALQLMILSGAKGSAVNAMQGLIDTAVKTSRSGYLQRCLVKHLEGLKIHYDGTVRDHDGSIVQFRYGEDGLDVTKSTYISPKTFPFLKGNLDAVMQCCKPREITDCMLNVEAAEKQYRKIKKWRKRTLVFNGHPNKKHYVSGFTEFSADHKGVAKDRIVALWAEMDVIERLKYEKRAQSKCPCAVNEKFNVNNTLGALPEKTLDSIYEFTGRNDKLRRSFFWKGMRSLVEPGENVGLLAAQSIGEPSTQMTLNTFHFAGRGEMNIPILPGMPQERINMIRRELDKVFLNQVLRKFSIEEKVNLVESGCWRRYYLRIEILSARKRQENARYLSRRTIMNEMEQRFLRALANAIAKKYRDVLEYQQMQHRKLRSGNQNAGLGVNEVAAGIRDDAAEYEGEEEDRVHVENDDDERQNDAEETEEEQNNNEAGSGDEEREPAERKITNVDERIKFVISQSNLIVDYKFDVSSERWCEVVFQLPLGNKSKLDLVTIVEKEVDKFVVHQTPGIERCIEIEEVLHDIPTKYLQTQGINLEAFFRHADVLDVNAIQTNDLNLVLRHYGVEACSKAIIQVRSHLLVVVSFTTIPELSKIGSVLYFLGLGLFFQLHEFQLFAF
ncbi:unnamed protein product [Angiostrongylus costaricensis]|uniref:DNA-directed RNA polymerase n=1 Tax=Angiostrongylus costaricensis TaxID=334426 RepID=A0A158PDT3_ANGCS|nr:unnamed protein product [Angiostrongylus costaricensis]